MVFDKIKEIIVEQLGVDESLITNNTHLMKDLEADSSMQWKSLWQSKMNLT